MSYSVSVSEVAWLFYQGRSVGCRERLIRADDGIHTVVPRQCSHSATTCTHDRRKYHAAKRFAERRRRVQFPPLTPSRFRRCLDGRHSAPLDRRATERRRLPSISRSSLRSHRLKPFAPMGVTSKPVRLLVQIAHTCTNAQTRPLVFIRLPLQPDQPGT